MTRYNLDGKVALVTGGARGIGLATAQALHGRGASVVLVDLDSAATEQSAHAVGTRAIGIAGDVTDRSSMQNTVAQAVDRFGSLDVCVANAGTTARFTTVRAMRPEVFERVVAVNLLGAYNTAYAALPHVIESQGHVSLVASIYAFSPGVFVAPYAASKAGVEQLARALRLELAPTGASAGVVFYGYIDTEMVAFEFNADPVAATLQHEILPRILRKKLTPQQGGEALVRGIERRAARVCAPARWAAMSTLRGVVNPPLDALLARHRQLHSLIGEADRPNRVDGAELSADLSEPEGAPWPT